MYFKRKIYLLTILLLFIGLSKNSYSIEPNIFVQSTVNRASAILSNDLTKEEKIEKLKEVALETVMIADEVTERILWQFDSILELGNAHTTGLVDYHKENYSTTRVIHYPGYKGPVEKKQMRIGEHTDYGTITLLWQLNDVPGLEVQDLDGNWHPVPYMKNGIVINIGDLLQRWTNDYFKSTKHRVVNSHIDKPRFSMPHFVDPKPGTIVKNLTKQPDKYEPIESLEYLKWRLSKSY